MDNETAESRDASDRRILRFSKQKRRDRATTVPESSPLVRRFAERIADAGDSLPILDVACGAGRNAILFAQLSKTVVCVDQDLSRLESLKERWRHTSLAQAASRLRLQTVDLIQDAWPFGPCVLGAIINVHFFLPSLLPYFERSLSQGGYLLLETIPGRGGNYRSLPKKGEVRQALEETFDFEHYKERKAGPTEYDAVVVQLVARKKLRK